MSSSKVLVRWRIVREAMLVSSSSIFAIADAFFEATSALSSTALIRGKAFAFSFRDVWATYCDCPLRDGYGATYCDYEVDALCQHTQAITCPRSYHTLTACYARSNLAHRCAEGTLEAPLKNGTDNKTGAAQKCSGWRLNICSLVLQAALENGTELRN